MTRLNRFIIYLNSHFLFAFQLFIRVWNTSRWVRCRRCMTMLLIWMLNLFTFILDIRKSSLNLFFNFSCLGSSLYLCQYKQKFSKLFLILFGKAADFLQESKRNLDVLLYKHFFLTFWIYILNYSRSISTIILFVRTISCCHWSPSYSEWIAIYIFLRLFQSFALATHNLQCLRETFEVFLDVF